MQIDKPIVLASQSPRRAFLLKEMGLEFDILPANGDEIIDPSWPIERIPEMLAIEKTAEVLGRLTNDAIVIGADTIVTHRGEVLGKPKDNGDAERMLRQLAGDQHEVFTGISIRDRHKHVSAVSRTVVTCLPLTEAEITQYIVEYQPLDKAGSYGIQDWLGWCKISHIDGSYANVMGLPTHEVYTTLRSW